ncbi:MAG: hypothetical protein QM756_01095 [Polyangiaceae bacterium]
MHYTPRTDNGAGAAIGCPADELQVDAELRLESSGGALAERRQVVLRATSASKASIRADLPLAEVAGSLRVVPASGYKVTSPVVVAEVDAATTHGALEGLLEQQSGDAVSARYITYVCCLPEGSTECQRP